MRLSMFDRRRAGALLHLGSLDAALGRGGRAFIDWLADAGYSVWQILPVGPTGADGSPYWVRSDYAGRYAFVDRQELPDARAPEYEAFLASSSHWLDRLRVVRIIECGTQLGALVALARGCPRS